MCGRYNIITDTHALIDAFEIFGTELDFRIVETNYNIYPSPVNAKPQQIVKAPVIRSISNQYQCSNLVWPFVPIWSKGVVPKYATANARAETLATSKSYQHAWKNNQRCLVIASGFYEWQVLEEKKHKQPYHIRLKEQPVFAMAGIWESSKTQNQEIIESFSIVTTEANLLMAKIHNTKKRMPVILQKNQYTNWLGTDNLTALSCIQSLAQEKMVADKISTYVNIPANNDAKCIETDSLIHNQNNRSK